MTQTATEQAVTQTDMALAATDLSLTQAARDKMAELFGQVDDDALQAIRDATSLDIDRAVSTPERIRAVIERYYR